jgi:hypothetical protein
MHNFYYAMYIMSRCIAKYLKKLKRLIIWNWGSSSNAWCRLLLLKSLPGMDRIYRSRCMAGEREQLQPAGRLISSFKSLNGRGGGNMFRGHGPSSCVVCHASVVTACMRGEQCRELHWRRSHAWVVDVSDHVAIRIHYIQTHADALLGSNKTDEQYNSYTWA